MTQLSVEQIHAQLATLKERFENNRIRHQDTDWPVIEKKLMSQPDKLWSLYQMEQTGGQPDVVKYNSSSDTFVFFDCSPQSPEGRRNLCFDKQAWEDRKEYKPLDNALDVATRMGIKLLSEDEYRFLQTLGEFDTKTSSWIQTPQKIRQLGGALFADRRYDQTFVYHNGASSYYAVRGFRGSLRV